MVPRTRHRRLGVLALPIALTALFGSSLPSRPIDQLGEVDGVIAAAPSAPPATATPAAPDSRFAYVRPTDREGPRSGIQALAPRPATLTGYRWPLGRGRLTLPFKAIPGGTRIKDGKLFHDGVDLATFCGDTVRAAHDGVVLAAGRRFDDVAGWIGDLGPYYRILDRKKLWDDLPIVVVTDDGNGYRSIYAHFGKIVVKRGASVHAGQLLGYEGATGRASGCHLHYGLFSPLETARFAMEPDVMQRMKIPGYQIARVDPLRVLPPR